MTVRARKVLLLIGILTAGAAIEAAWRVRDHVAFGPTGWRVLSGSFHGPSHVFEVSAQHALEPGQPLRIENAFGDVRVFAGEPGEVRVLHRKRVYDADKTQGEAFAGRVELAWTDSAEKLVLETNRQQLSQEQRNVGWESHLEVAVPPETGIEIANEHGNVDVADVGWLSASTSYAPLEVRRVSGATELRARHGSVKATNIGGPLRLSARHTSVHVEDVAGAVDADVQHGSVQAMRVGGLKLQLRDGDLKAESVTGALELHGSRAGVIARDVSGNTTIRTSYRNVELREAQGAAHVELRHGALTVHTLRGPLTGNVSHGDAELEAIARDVNLEMRSGTLTGRDLGAGVQVRGAAREVTLGAFHGPLILETNEADVKLTPAHPFTQDVSVQTERGTIRIDIPEGAGFEVVAESDSGQVECDVAGFEASESSRRKVTGRAGDGGPLVRLRTGRGDVYVVRTSVEANE